MVNPFMVMIMQSHEDADKIIEEIKQYIDNLDIALQEIEFDIPDTILDYDKKRIEEEIKKYYFNKRYK